VTATSAPLFLPAKLEEGKQGYGHRLFGAMEFFSKVVRPPVLAGLLLAGLKREHARAKATQKGKSKGAAMGPTNLDVTADAAHLCCVSVCLSCLPAHFISAGTSTSKEQNWRELAEKRSRAFHPKWVPHLGLS
jgi:hypothetical protein